MAGNLIGRRRSQEDAWVWTREPQPESPGDGPRWRVALVIGIIAVVVLVVAVSLVLSSERGGSPSATPTPTPSESPSPIGGVVPTATSAPEGARFQLAVWSDRTREWRFSDLRPEESDYREGEAVPFLLRIDGAQTGQIYRTSLRYGCREGVQVTFDFLTGYDRDAGSAPALAVGQRERPDSAIHIPDDPAIDLDDGEGERLFNLWGGTFEAAPIGPEPEALCRGEKRVVLGIRAKEETLFLLWGSHLGSLEDRAGAEDGQGIISVEVEVDGAIDGAQEVGLLPDAVGG